VIAGGSGFLGRLLTAHFSSKSRPVVVLSRQKLPDVGLVRHVVWDGQTLGPWSRELEGAELLINLAGRSVNCRYNARNKQEIYDSRLKPTETLGRALIVSAEPPKVWFNASSATIYRHEFEEPMDEIAGHIGHGFSVDVCEQWEKLFFEVSLRPTRRVAMRTAIVFGRDGDAFRAFRRLVNLGLGGKMGSGRQYVSWIHAEDFVRAVEFLLENDKLKGPVNLASPNPLPNREFMRTFRKVCGRPIGLPATESMLKLGAVLLGTETELILKSRRVVPGKLRAYGFEFKFPQWRDALENIVHGVPPKAQAEPGLLMTPKK
jgi:uncharacterized protein (TIGR01777 family)